MLLSRQNAQELFQKVLKYSTADETEAMIGSSSYSLTRFANNIIHQNVTEEGQYLSVRAVTEKRTARATTVAMRGSPLRTAAGSAVSVQQPVPVTAQVHHLRG